MQKINTTYNTQTPRCAITQGNKEKEKKERDDNKKEISKRRERER
jgi:hypothetical protein